MAAEEEPRPRPCGMRLAQTILEAARLSAQQIEGGAQGAYEEVALVAGQRLAALTCDVDVQPGVGHPDDHVVVQPQ